MAVIQVSRLARKLQRSLRLTHLPDSILSLETVPVIVVEDLSAPLEDEDRGCMGASTVAAVAGENSIVVLTRVGAPAEYDLVINSIAVSSPTTQQIIIAKPTAGVVGLFVSGNTNFTNFTIPGRPSSQLGLDTQIGLPPHSVLAIYEILAQTTYLIPLKVRIGTFGDGQDFTSLMVAAPTVNTQLSVGFNWTESAPQG